MCVGAVFLFGVAAPWRCTGRRKSERRNYARRSTSLRSARACVESRKGAAIVSDGAFFYRGCCFSQLCTSKTPRTVVAAVSLPAVRMKQLHSRRSDASHQFPFSAIEALDAFPPALHPVADHSNDLGRIVTQEEVRLAPSPV
ncbi:uncharacterized protein LOC142572262 [Dermacentor variabilis]|uniref:uncharacterized protein LOC142572262 n=1 Tax=Dermacentor variabilis TaxID=34621 RepID=UPI003F5B13B0